MQTTRRSVEYANTIVDVINNNYTTMLWCCTPDNLSFINLCCSRRLKKVWERCSQAFPPHYIPGSTSEKKVKQYCIFLP